MFLILNYELNILSLQATPKSVNFLVHDSFYKTSSFILHFYYFEILNCVLKTKVHFGGKKGRKHSDVIFIEKSGITLELSYVLKLILFSNYF